MSIQNIYKKICFVLILVGIVLYSGTCVYAHNSELMKALEVLQENATIKDIKHVVDLLEKDAVYHDSIGETVEAERSKVLAALLSSEIIIQSYAEPTEKQIEEVVDRIQTAVNLLEDMEDTKQRVDSQRILHIAKIKLASFESKGALLRVQKNPTVKNWTLLSKLILKESILYNDIGNVEVSKYLLAQSKEAEATRAFFEAEENSTIENWTETALLYNEAFEIYGENECFEGALKCFRKAIYANKMISSLGGAQVEIGGIE